MQRRTLAVLAVTVVVLGVLFVGVARIETHRATIVRATNARDQAQRDDNVDIAAHDRISDAVRAFRSSANRVVASLADVTAIGDYAVSLERMQSMKKSIASVATSVRVARARLTPDVRNHEATRLDATEHAADAALDATTSFGASLSMVMANPMLALDESGEREERHGRRFGAALADLRRKASILVVKLDDDCTQKDAQVAKSAQALKTLERQPLLSYILR